MKKRKNNFTIRINLSNRWLYTFIVLGVLIAVGVGVYAYGTDEPVVFGHSVNELDFTGGFSVPSGNIVITDGNLQAKSVCISGDCRSSWPQTTSYSSETKVVIYSSSLSKGDFTNYFCNNQFGPEWHVCTWKELKETSNCLQYTSSGFTSCNSELVTWSANLPGAWTDCSTSSFSNFWTSASSSLYGAGSRWSSSSWSPLGTAKGSEPFIYYQSYKCNELHNVACCA